MAIPVQDARGVFTRQIVARWNELSELAPKGFLRSFFTKKTTDTKEISIEVMRGTEKIAVDVLRGTDGNRNSFSRSAEKIFVPPFFNEYFDMTELDKYDLLFGMNANDVSVNTVTSVIEAALEKVAILRYKIERAYELYASQVFESGIVLLVSGDNIDFKRKAGSMVVKDAPEYWTVNTVDPREQLKAGANFLRQTGKASDGEYNIILGQSALTALLANPFIVNNLIKDVKLIDLNMPQASASGGILHGKISFGSYIGYLWSYPEYYDDSTGVATPYIDDDYFYMLPVRSGKFVMSFAGVPMVVKDSRNAEFPEFITQVAADYALYNFMDTKKMKHDFGIMSAGLPIPVSIDRIYSSKVTGSGGVIGG
ncbi:MAG: major capsid protein [Atribacterota bacterium]|nr:major capsid protein [Atribacterota bacterium]